MFNIKKVFSILETTHQLTMLEILKDYTPFQQLVATLLSARTKDSRLIPIVKDLFKDYPSPRDLAKINIYELEKRLFQVGFYRVKSSNVKKLSKIILEKYDLKNQGKIPDNLNELISLPGVGRKTANCILANAFKIPAIGVDTHVHRISNRLGWVKTNTPEETELSLMKIIPKPLWIKVNNLLVNHGQRICNPINPKCGECKIRKYCQYGNSLD
ncbi:MAG: endonuclease III [Candidatus Woesearchaeota archaeon]